MPGALLAPPLFAVDVMNRRHRWKVYVFPSETFSLLSFSVNNSFLVQLFLCEPFFDYLIYILNNSFVY